MGACCSAAAPADAPAPARNNIVNELDIKRLASETHFTVNEVEALYELFKRVSNSLVKDGLIHKEEFCLALFKSQRENLFANRVFEIFDEKQNDVIEFGEFVHALSVFHPKAPLHEKAEFAFRIYDLGNTGAIDRSEIRTMLVAMLKDDNTMRLPDAALERIIDQTFAVASAEVRLSQEHSITPGEWLAFVNKMPNILNNMTLPVLRELTTAFPSFVLNSVASAGEMNAGGDALPLAPRTR